MRCPPILNWLAASKIVADETPVILEDAVEIEPAVRAFVTFAEAADKLFVMVAEPAENAFDIFAEPALSEPPSVPFPLMLKLVDGCWTVVF